MKTYCLTSAAIPAGLPKRQAQEVYGFLQPFGRSYSLDDLLAKAIAANFRRLFKREDSTTERDSLMYHLNRFKKAGYIRVVEENTSA